VKNQEVSGFYAEEANGWRALGGNLRLSLFFPLAGGTYFTLIGIDAANSD